MRVVTVAVAIACVSAFVASANASLVIRGVVDGPLSLDGNGGDPKALVFEATADIADLSIFGAGTANNGGGSDGQEYSFPAITASTGDIFVVTADSTHTDFLTSRYPAVTAGWNDAIAFINGDDPFELYENGSVIDTYGDVALDGSGEDWEYTDSFAVRTGGSAGAFVLANYAISPVDSLDGLDEAGAVAALVPLFGQAVPEPSSVLIAVMALTGVGAVAMRRRLGWARAR